MAACITFMNCVMDLKKGGSASASILSSRLCPKSKIPNFALPSPLRTRLRWSSGSLAAAQGRACILNPKEFVEVAFERILEVAVRKDKLGLAGITKLKISVALWHGGLPVDVLPSEAFLEVPLGEE